MRWLCLTATVLSFVCVPASRADDDYQRTRDVIYGRKYGLAMTLDVFAPKKNANGLAVISVVSGGWFSTPDAINPDLYTVFLKRGYTVFAVVHGSQPKFTIDEIIQDMHRAVRFIRYHAKTYHIDADRLGVMGASAGGHLALMLGTAGGPGDPKARDPIDRVSSKVQCVACFFPPTDFLNFGADGKELINRALQPPFTAAVDYKEFDRKRALYVPITDEKKLREIARQVSPITHVDARSAPTLLIHGDKDTLVPLQQSESLCAKLKKCGVDTELLVRKGVGHEALLIVTGLKSCADWFDRHLVKEKKSE